MSFNQIIAKISYKMEFSFQQVYVQIKLLPNLVNASKIICMVKKENSSVSSSSSSNLAISISNHDQAVFK